MKTGRIKRWEIAEFSLVPTAASPKAKDLAVRSIENHELLGRPFGVDVGKIMGEYKFA